ncbi:MAG: clostripain-related cysteine peptidase [Candidatus Sericytochromatia bacterium]
MSPSSNNNLGLGGSTLFLCLLLLCLIPAWAQPPYVKPTSPPKAAWTVMVYMSGDNDLDAYIVKDLENELAIPGSNARVKVLALADRAPKQAWSETLLFEVLPGLKATPANALANWGERNLGDPQTLLEFVTWARHNHPAERYALYFWGHGWNWHSGYIMEDSSSQDALDPHELQVLLPQLGVWDVVGYDGCNMASIEVEMLWQGHAKTLVHSQEFVDWDGLAYDRIFKVLNLKPDIQAEELAILSALSASYNQERTGSAVVLDGRFDALIQAVDQWSLALMAGLPRYKTEFNWALKQAQQFEEAADEIDLIHLAQLFKLNLLDARIRETSAQVEAAAKASLLHAWHRADYPEANGITISALAPDDPQRDVYLQSAFAQRTHWDEFLKALWLLR